MTIPVITKQQQQPTGGPGAVQARTSPHGAAHRSKVDRIYTRVYVPTGLEQIDYRCFIVHKGLQQLVDGILPGLDWSDTGPVLTGTISLMNDDDQRPKLQIGNGDRVRLQVRWQGKWSDLWTMRIWDPQDDVVNESYSGTLFDDLHVLEISTDDFHFRRHKTKRPHGYKCHEILIAIARRYKIPLGKVARGTYDIKNLEMNDVSPLDVIVRAYRLERQHSGRRFVMRFRSGKLEVVPLQRNPVLYVLQSQLQAAVIGIETPDNYATALTGRWVTKKKKGHMMVTGNLDRGFVHKQAGLLTGIDSRHEAEVRLKHMLAQRQSIKPAIPITHALIPFVRRGDATQVLIPSRGISGDKSLLWVSSGEYHLSAGDATMDLEFSWTDPIASAEAAQKAADKAKRAAKRSKKK